MLRKWKGGGLDAQWLRFNQAEDAGLKLKLPDGKPSIEDL
jgi:hypothetical protein